MEGNFLNWLGKMCNGASEKNANCWEQKIFCLSSPPNNLFYHDDTKPDFYHLSLHDKKTRKEETGKRCKTFLFLR